MASKTPLIIITGPTCSGKTRLAFKLAKDYPIEVISADSMQVYRHLDIGTAKPSLHERAFLKHHLVDIVDPDQEFNAGMFVQEAKKALVDVESISHIPLVVGGTGLYIKALVYGLSNVPKPSKDIRYFLSKIIQKRGKEYMYNMLKRMDPSYASSITQGDRSKIARALEIIFITGKRPSDIHAPHSFSRPVIPAHIVCIVPDRDTLYNNINSRVASMVDKGLVRETERVLDMGYSPELPSLKNFTYRHVISYMHSKVSLDRMIQLIQRDTRHFAKRQITWFRANSPRCTFVDMKEAGIMAKEWIKKYNQQ